MALLQVSHMAEYWNSVPHLAENSVQHRFINLKFTFKICFSNLDTHQL